MSASLATTTVCIVLALIFITLRLYARTALVRNFGGDDYLITGSFVRDNVVNVGIKFSNLTLVVVAVALYHVSRR